MALTFHPQQGTVVVCDFKGLKRPEMVKRRPAIILSPRFRTRKDLCTITPLSTTMPNSVEPYHYRLVIDPPLPEPYSAPFHWVKADMIYTVALARLSLPFDGKDSDGKRNYDIRVLDGKAFSAIQKCVLNGLGLAELTPHL